MGKARASGKKCQATYSTGSVIDETRFCHGFAILLTATSLFFFFFFTREQLYCEFPSKISLHKILEYSFHVESQDKSPFWKEKNGSYKGFEKSSLSLVFLRNFFPKHRKNSKSHLLHGR